jgi:outer membrane protein
MSNCIAAQDKIGGVNMDKLMERSPETKKAIAMLKKMQDSLQIEYNQLAKEINEATNKFAKDTLCRMFVPDPEKTINERKKIADDVTRFMSLNETHQNLLKAKADTIFTAIRNKLKESLKTIANENGYCYILELFEDSKLTLAFYDDITEFVIVKLGL